MRKKEAEEVGELYDTEIWHKCCKRVVGYLGFGRRDMRYKGRFSGVRKTYYADIREEL